MSSIQSTEHTQTSADNASMNMNMDIRDLHEAFCQHQEAIKNFRPKTIAGYKQTFRTFLSVSPQIKDINQVSFFDVQQYFYWGRVERKWQSISFITHHKHLNVFFKWAVKNKIIKENPFEQIEKPKLEKKLPRRLNKQQAMVLLDAAYNMPYPCVFLRYRNHAIIATYLYCGLRKTELLNLKCSDVDLENGILNIKQGKGNKDRSVPMPQPLIKIFERYAQERSKLNRTCPQFFVSSNQDCGYTDSGLKRFVDRLKKTTGINFYVHMLRHTFATLMIEGGCDIYSVSKIMGHTDIKTTTIYLAASVEHLRSEIVKHPLNFL